MAHHQLYNCLIEYKSLFLSQLTC